MKTTMRIESGDFKLFEKFIFEFDENTILRSSDSGQSYTIVRRAFAFQVELLVGMWIIKDNSKAIPFYSSFFKRQNNNQFNQVHTCINKKTEYSKLFSTRFKSNANE